MYCYVCEKEISKCEGCKKESVFEHEGKKHELLFLHVILPNGDVMHLCNDCYETTIAILGVNPENK